ncbi:hypothetical protein CERZMDRAFT_99156 [Cercospora zeae-maydis SCOH1-5]|uniref:Uncharacterized protein n=1 Tax=Cercospora zeae-maydis SCOH1-5 TaxID=717836 RepID=A0A6A6FAX6_9PEZI|nr:hypothetical protein CERZMDRAFT_99156 [Cercospora zeae-maydis SCOH1-5]
MESPSAPAQPRVEESTFDHNEPSSPFVSEANSRLMSKTWDTPIAQTEEEQHTMDIFATPMEHGLVDAAEDKENVPETGNTINKLRPATPPESKALPDSPVNAEARRGSTDSDLMPPPPSTHKSQTPKRSPLKPARYATGNAQTPRTATSPRKNSFGSELTQSTPRGSNSIPESRTTQHCDSSFDDTCFSAFSEVPDMTTWAKMGQSPTKRGEALRTPGRQKDATPRTSRKRSSPSRSPSPTPRRSRVGSKSGHGHSSSHDGTTFLIDFTQQMDNMSGYSRHTSPAKSSTQPDLLQFMNSQRSPHKSTRPSYATPAKQSSIMNLLDFELPPAPTPRSVPTITVRELESLKSSYLSQISSLKATLSGREAEVESLKRAVGDAERRVGEAQERLREEKNRREDAEEQKAGWEKRGQEVEHLLKDVKEEVMKSEAEKEELARKVEEYERRIEDSEARAVKAEERYADALAARAAAGDGGDADPSAVEDRVQRLVAAQIDSKIEAVSRELHAVYKEKHERKVATLKKSYEARGEKKCAELQTRLHQLEKQNDELLAAKDATFSGPVAGDMTFCGEAEAELKAQIEEQRAQFARLEAEMWTSRQHQEQLERELAQERIEKGDLVAAVDEMLLLQSEQGPAQGAMSVVEDFRKSISRPASAMSSGLRAPASKIGGVGRPASGIGKGGMMSRIEKMGSSRNGGGHD